MFTTFATHVDLLPELYQSANGFRSAVTRMLFTHVVVDTKYKFHILLAMVILGGAHSDRPHSLTQLA